MRMLEFNFLDDVRRLNKRQLYNQILKLCMIVSSAVIIWKGLKVITDCASPIMVVLSGNTEPAFPSRGDILFLTNHMEEPIRVGEIVVFKVEGRDIPIIHRVIKVHEKESGSVNFLTKEDNNPIDDRGLYAPGQLWLEKRNVVGRVRGYVPYLGIVTILLNGFPKLKYVILSYLGMYVLTHRKENSSKDFIVGILLCILIQL